MARSSVFPFLAGVGWPMGAPTTTIRLGELRTRSQGYYEAGEPWT
jgi:hypothetical protein